jgi:hypothetical protein
MPAPRKEHEVKVTRDILYYKVAGDPDPYRHKLDVSAPRGKGPFPVLILLHGGTWMYMSKDDVLGLKARPFAHPYYWAAFVLAGDPR